MKSNLFKIYLILLGMCPMLSTDLYLPALPSISKYYGTTDNIANITMVAFTAALAVASLLWGPISDKYGRKPIVTAGSALYFAGSLLCVFAPSISFMIVFRVLQAVGGGSVIMIASALIKDVYEEQHQEKVLSLVQGMTLIGPAVAPSLGALVLRGSDWHAIFVVMTIMGAVIFGGALLLKETLRVPLTVKVWLTFTRLWAVLRNSGFTKVAIVSAIPAFPIMAFISASPYIFQARFGLSGQVFSLFFAASAIAMMGGSFSYFSFSRRFGHNVTAYVCFITITLSGLFILLVGSNSPWMLIGLIIPSSFCGSMAKPLGVFLGLKAAGNSDTGSASSLLNFIGLVFASLGILALGLFQDFLAGVGILYLLSGAVAIVFFLGFIRKV